MKVIAIGRNYIDHAKELNNPIPKEPVVFMKPDTALLKDNKDFYYPDFSNDIHYEAEIVLRVCKEGKHISTKFAHTYFDAIGLGIDFTARDIQQKHKEKGLPWELAKSFDGSAVISTLIPKENLGDLKNLDFSLVKNTELVQQGNTKDMIFSYEDLIVYISKFITLRKGDLIYTGTPAGVGPVIIGDTLVGYIGQEQMFSCVIK
ncbi:Homoprotocatechuate catabolism bifunctional isomerase/decarboxylase [compost metagenome]|uniref:fumarylacetoacetate hydrolase family protein n=1 Tax=Sphingobacterium faecium TaxID=34087 RepID=UPI000D38559D|nr:fumarylacetoacetate hydrolase family protein [Sphingobacterium faecium]MQP27577.1 2-hydroxyhepta-2,4-diene-1,7-dioate isomerase [Sphingobacterium faecium]PTX12828.1 2-keto-4-pentenoate hydratase/2-oxohepta-3-ene-1,7-dioic acid hydratase in catechol pathway [Sphingobacterium faecium]GEM62529.1 2-hydroxyhepta-2,4-diene-1,7-dioate isomerase [Sphingobacterium faecium NBRC 15299]